MAWRLQHNPNLAASIIKRPNSFNKSAGKAVAIIFVNVTLPKAGEKYIFYPVGCDVVDDGAPPLRQILTASEIIAYEATQ